MTPFYANYGHHPSSGTTSTETNVLSASSVAYGHRMKAVVENFKKELQKFSERMKKYADQSCIESRSFKLANLVMLDGKNINTSRPAPKLDQKIYRPFDILDIISPPAVRLRLPKTWQIYPVCHIYLIEPFIKGNRDVDLNAILKMSDPIENAPDYDVDKVMGATENDAKV
jgi:hypothetical protein